MPKPSPGKTERGLQPAAVRRSWGRYPRAHQQAVMTPEWTDEIPELLADTQSSSLLAYGLGRSYGDSCLNDGGALLDCSRLDRIIAFDRTAGVIECEAGVSLAEILRIALPHGWFLPVTPGTKFVTLAGAIANDVHGKNHHGAGTFGRHVHSFVLHRSDGSITMCSAATAPELFAATIGGMGLTGVLSRATLQLKAVAGPWIESETIPFTSLSEFQAISDASDQDWEYTVAWVDCVRRAGTRGIFFRGKHGTQQGSDPGGMHPRVPFDLPEFALNRTSMRVFNALYYWFGRLRAGKDTVHYEPFFYPLDSIRDWNRIYSARGFLQYQFVVAEAEALQEIFSRITAAGSGSFLAVLKRFGNVPSPGMMSFPRSGLTLALDFPMRGGATLKLLDELDAVVSAAGGAVYPAKDARMSQRMFATSFPRWREFERYIDPRCSSSFWRRVTGKV